MTIDPEYHEVIQARAYLLWIEEGRPDGRDVEHWHRAVELVANDAAHPNTPAGATGSGRRKAPTEGKPKSKAVKKTRSTD